MPSTDRPTGRLLVAVAVMCGSLLCGACAGSPSARHVTAAASAPASPASPAAPGTSVEEIAGALGCTAELSVEADELRQGACETAQGAYSLTTFTAQQGLRSWLDETRTYGGVYLVGDRWVVTGPSADALTALHDRLGGTLETGTDHTGHTDHTDPSPTAEGHAHGH